MNLLLVTFSLRNATRDYGPFFVALRGNSLQWWHYIEQTCVVVTVFDHDAFAKKLVPHLALNDSLLVAKLTPHEFQGWLPKEAWEWLNTVSATLKPIPPAYRKVLPPQR